MDHLIEEVKNDDEAVREMSSERIEIIRLMVKLNYFFSFLSFGNNIL